MQTQKLPSDLEQILMEIIQKDNPTRYLSNRFSEASQQERKILQGHIKDLTSHGYLQVKWAGNRPYFVTINNSARTYAKQLSQSEVKSEMDISPQEALQHTIFISHRSTDKNIADMLVEFFSGTGISRESIFCSSLPGNDVNEAIPGEIKAALSRSTINIAILSSDYYQSAFCLNEAGVLWYQDKPVIPIALPEINSSNMYGFLDSSHRLRRLDCDTDASYIYDSVREALGAPHTKSSIITYENNKLREKYSEFIGSRVLCDLPSPDSIESILSEITTDDECIVLYYILQKNTRKINKEAVDRWLTEQELHEVDVENGFDLLSSIDGIATDESFELGIDLFRFCSTNKAIIMSALQETVDQHIKLAANRLTEMWPEMDTVTKLFVAYIVDERMCTFGDRWKAGDQIRNIKDWESKNCLNADLSDNYGTCLEFFKINSLVYECSWTSYGNPREYTIYPSLQQMLFNCSSELREELNTIKKSVQMELPF